MAKKKPITLTAYEISTAESTTKELNPSLAFTEVLKGKSIEERFLKLSELDESKEGDVVLNYQAGKNSVFGVIVRMKESEFAQISSEQFGKEKITFDEIERKLKEDIVGVVNQYAYFLLIDKYLIHTSKTLLKSFQAYLNYLLEEKVDFKYSFNPKINKAKNAKLKLKDISSVSISEVALYGNKDYEYVNKSISDLKDEFMKFLLSEVRDLQEIEKENIISAQIHLKIKRLSKKESPETEKALQALLKFSNENEDIVATTRDGKKVTGDEISVVKKVRIETTQGGFPNELQLKQEMDNFLKEFKDGS